MKKEFGDFKEGMKNDFENFEKKIVSLLHKKRKWILLILYYWKLYYKKTTLILYIKTFIKIVK